MDCAILEKPLILPHFGTKNDHGIAVPDAGVCAILP
jgi:hypothetical protein